MTAININVLNIFNSKKVTYFEQRRVKTFCHNFYKGLITDYGHVIWHSAGESEILWHSYLHFVLFQAFDSVHYLIDSFCHFVYLDIQRMTAIQRLIPKPSPRPTAKPTMKYCCATVKATISVLSAHLQGYGIYSHKKRRHVRRRFRNSSYYLGRFGNYFCLRGTHFSARDLNGVTTVVLSVSRIDSSLICGSLIQLRGLKKTHN